MLYPYRLHQHAHHEYIEAYEWYELRKEGLGVRFMECVEKRLKQISDYPERYNKKHGITGKLK